MKPVFILAFVGVSRLYNEPLFSMHKISLGQQIPFKAQALLPHKKQYIILINTIQTSKITKQNGKKTVLKSVKSTI
jgi:hypothetical protein